MRVFLSWSGVLSHKVALLLKDWLPSVIQATEPYVSSEDIDKGTRWSSDIATELKECSFGILCVTHENLEAPWLNFEAGALSKTFENTFVVPFLIDLKRSDVHGPILQFQSTVYEREDIKKLLITINNATPEKKLEPTRLDSIFDVFWPMLDEKLNLLVKESANKSQVKKQRPDEKEDSKTAAILEELLDLARNQYKILSKTEDSGTLNESGYRANQPNRKTYSRLINELNKIDKFLAKTSVFLNTIEENHKIGKANISIELLESMQTSLIIATDGAVELRIDLLHQNKL